MVEPIVPEYVNEKFLEGLTGISVKTWQWLRHTGKGPAYHKIGRRCQYHLPTVRSWLASCRRASTSEMQGSAEGQKS